jgi:hypothetical protein
MCKTQEDAIRRPYCRDRHGSTVYVNFMLLMQITPNNQEALKQAHDSVGADKAKLRVYLTLGL